MRKEEKPRRKPYAKPEVRRVHLTPEESLATGCKMTTGTGPGPTNSCQFNSCFATGS